MDPLGSSRFSLHISMAIGLDPVLDPLGSSKLKFQISIPIGLDPVLDPLGYIKLDAQITIASLARTFARGPWSWPRSWS